MKIEDFTKEFSLQNTYKLKSVAKYYKVIKTTQELVEVLNFLKNNNISYFIIGAGSNLILDEYFDGAVLKLDFNSLEIQDKNITVGAGVMMNKLAKSSVNASLTGLEWAINIPGTVGGSIVNNAGAYNSDIFDTLISVDVLTPDLKVKTILKKDIKYNYRSTDLKKKNLIVLEASFLLDYGNRDESCALIKNRCERRLATQPLDMPSAGSVFRNPDNDHAGRLIEEAGLKGKTIGGAQVSQKHANFIVNTGTATSKDIKNLIKLIQEEVKTKFGVDLILEQEIVDWK